MDFCFQIAIHLIFNYLQAGYEYDDATFDKVFKRIYSTFGSSAPYSIFPDSQSFLRWARHQGIIVGIVSNAEYRYQDVILPSLGLHKVLTFNTFHIESIHSLKIHYYVFLLLPGIRVGLRCVLWACWC